jgi:hypothetical protein
MKLIVAGGRKFNDKARVFRLLNKIHAEHPDLEIVSGLAKGPDTFGKKWAEANGIKCYEFPAQWNKYGKRAGYLRNEEMAKFAGAVLLFWDKISKGTMHMRDLGYKHNLPVAIAYYDPDTGEPPTVIPKGISKVLREDEQVTLRRHRDNREHT